jgi:hypothetical protein
MSVPTLLALAGTALMAVAIFMPFRVPAVPNDADVKTAVPPRWPELVEPSATGCDARARLDLVDALASIHSAWALGVLHRANEDETDPAVRAAIASALDTANAPLVG